MPVVLQAATSPHQAVHTASIASATAASARVVLRTLAETRHHYLMADGAVRVRGHARLGRVPGCFGCRASCRCARRRSARWRASWRRRHCHGRGSRRDQPMGGVRGSLSAPCAGRSVGRECGVAASPVATVGTRLPSVHRHHSDRLPRLGDRQCRQGAGFHSGRRRWPIARTLPKCPSVVLHPTHFASGAARWTARGSDAPENARDDGGRHFRGRDRGGSGHGVAGGDVTHGRVARTCSENGSGAPDATPHRHKSSNHFRKYHRLRADSVSAATTSTTDIGDFRSRHSKSEIVHQFRDTVFISLCACPVSCSSFSEEMQRNVHISKVLEG